jgi:hypothetical protein
MPRVLAFQGQQALENPAALTPMGTVMREWRCARPRNFIGQRIEKRPPTQDAH